MTNEEVLQQVLIKAIKVAENTGEFVVNQAPDVVLQLLTWHITIGIICTIPLTLFLIAWYRLEKFGYKWTIDNEGTGGDVWFTYLILGTLLRLVGLAVILIMAIPVLYGLQAFIAPKLFLLEYAADLIK